MSIFNNPEENYWRNFATKTVLILITVAIIVWFLPRNEGRMFRYDVGKPWMYGSVIAKFDFPIYTSYKATVQCIYRTGRVETTLEGVPWFPAEGGIVCSQS